MTAPAYSAEAHATGNSSTPAVTLPAGIANGTFAIIAVVTGGANQYTLSAVPSGWLPLPRCGSTAGLSGNVGGGGDQSGVTWFYYKFLQASDSSTSVSFTMTGSQNWSAQVATYTNVNPDVPFGGVSSGLTSGATLTFPSAYPGFAGGLAVAICAGNGNTDSSLTALSGTTTNWTKNTSYNGNTNCGSTFASNSASVASASATPVAAGLQLVVGLFSMVYASWTGVLNSADYDFSIPVASAGFTGMSGVNAGGGSNNVNILPPANVGPYIVPGMVLCGVGHADTSTATVSSITGPGTVTVVRTDSGNGTKQTLFTVVCTTAGASTLGDPVVAVVWSTSGLFMTGSAFGVVMANGINATNSAFSALGATTTPDPPATGSGTPAGDSLMMVLLTARSAGSTIGTISGYTEGLHGTHNPSSASESSAFYKLRPQTVGDDNPPAGASFTSRAWNVYTVEVQPLGQPPVNTVPPAVTGTPDVGSVLTTDDGTWLHTPLSYAYQWQAYIGGVWTSLSGKTASTYTIALADGPYTLGTDLRCHVTATNFAGSASADSNTKTVTSPPVNTVAPVASGIPETGQVLSVTTGTWTGTATITYTYQWQKYHTGAWSDIAGKTSSTYTPASVDFAVGDLIRCNVTGTNSRGNSTAPSNATNGATKIDFTNQFASLSAS